MKKSISYSLLLVFFCCSIKNFAQEKHPSTPIFPPNSKDPITLVPYHKKDKWGFANRKGELVIKAEYDWVEFFSEELAMVVADNKIGFIDQTGKVVIPLIYDNSDFQWEHWFIDGKIRVRSKEVEYQIDKKGNVLTARYLSIYDKYEYVRAFTNGITVVHKISGCRCLNLSSNESILVLKAQCDSLKKLKGKWECTNGYSELYGLIDSLGNELAPFDYRFIDSLHNGLARFSTHSGGGFFNERGKVVIPPTYESAYNFKDGLAMVHKEIGTGFIDTNGNVKIPLIYSGANRHVKGYIMVSKKMDDKSNRNSHEAYGLFNKEGKEIIPVKFQSIRNDDGDNFIEVRDYESGKCGIYRNDGRILIAPKYDGVFEFYEGRATFNVNGKWGFVDTNGREVIPAQFSQVQKFKKGLCEVAVYSNAQDSRSPRKWGCIDKQGKFVVPAIYDSPLYFYGEISVTAKKVSGKFNFGCIDNQNKIIIPFIYDEGYVHDQLVFLKSGKSWYIFNAQGKKLNEIGYEKIIAAYPPINGFLQVKRNNKYGLLDKTGKQIADIWYDTIMKIKNGFVKFIVNKKVGLFDSTGREVVQPKYDKIGDFDSGMAKVTIDNKMGLINQQGNEIIPVMYDEISFFGDYNKENKWIKDTLHMQVRINNKWGMYYIRLKKSTPIKYDYINGFKYGVSKVTVDSKIIDPARIVRKFGFINEQGEEVAPLKYETYGSEGWQEDGFERGLMVITYGIDWELVDSVGGPILFGIIDTLGREIVSTKYNRIEFFDKNYLRVKIKDKWGLINTKGKETTEIKYDFIETSCNGSMTASLQNKRGVIDPSGKEIIPFKYDIILRRCTGYIVIIKNGKYGVIDESENQIIKTKYDDLEWPSNYNNSVYGAKWYGFARVKINGKWGLIDSKGIEYFE